MNPAFVPSTPVSQKPILGRSVCPTSSSSLSSRPARATLSVPVMSAGGEKKEQSLMDWLYGKFMHNALWEGDEQVGYEPFFKDAMSARDEMKQKAYKEQDQQ